MKLFRLATYRKAFAVAVALTASVIALSPASAEAPGRVARLSDVVGDIQLANDREGWHPISRNFPITAGDNIFVSQGGRAELDVGSIQAWVAGGSQVYFEQFDDQHVAARLVSGAIAVRVRSLEGGESVRVLTPYGEIAFAQPGFYLVTTPAVGAYDPQLAQPALKVRAGVAQFLAPHRSPLAVRQGQVLLLDRNELRDSHFYRAPALERFEAWTSIRDSRIGRVDQRYTNFVSPLMIGARDLAEYGTWADGYEYGTVWYPASVAPDWAPYRYGRWSWVQPWGWTWVDDAAWGFAPFHYGRWVRIGSRWAWSPGQWVARPIYAPALVTFFGGDQWRYGNAGPTFSWVPLGWNEPFTPWYTYTPTYWREVNRPYVRHHYGDQEPWRPQTFVHAAMPGAITAVASAAFLAGRPVAQNYYRNVNERDLRSAPPARMGEVLPSNSRFANPAPPPAPARAGEPNRFPTAPIVRPQGRIDAPYIVPNTNVLQPRVIPDSDFGPGRQPPSSNTRINEPAMPMPKPRDDRAMPPHGPSMPPAPVAPLTAPTSIAPSAPPNPPAIVAPPPYRGVAPQSAPSPLPQTGPNPQMNAPSAPVMPARGAENRNAPSPDTRQPPSTVRSGPPTQLTQPIQPPQPAYPPLPTPPAAPQPAATQPPATAPRAQPMPDAQRVSPSPSAVTAPARPSTAVVLPMSTPAAAPAALPTTAPTERRAPPSAVLSPSEVVPAPSADGRPKSAVVAPAPDPAARQDNRRTPVQPNAPQPLQQ